MKVEKIDVAPGRELEEQWPVDDWIQDVSNGDTRLGYAEWVQHQLESHADDVLKALKESEDD